MTLAIMSDSDIKDIKDIKDKDDDTIKIHDCKISVEDRIDIYTTEYVVTVDNISITKNSKTNYKFLAESQKIPKWTKSCVKCTKEINIHKDLYPKIVYIDEVEQLLMKGFGDAKVMIDLVFEYLLHTVPKIECKICFYGDILNEYINTYIGRCAGGEKCPHAGMLEFIKGNHAKKCLYAMDISKSITEYSYKPPELSERTKTDTKEKLIERGYLMNNKNTWILFEKIYLECSSEDFVKICEKAALIKLN